MMARYARFDRGEIGIGTAMTFSLDSFNGVLCTLKECRLIDLLLMHSFLLVIHRKIIFQWDRQPPPLGDPRNAAIS